MARLQRSTRSNEGIRAVRIARGLSQDELGFRARIAQSRISRAERGYITLSEDERQRLAAVLRVDLHMLETSDGTGLAD